MVPCTCIDTFTPCKPSFRTILTVHSMQNLERCSKTGTAFSSSRRAYVGLWRNHGHQQAKNIPLVQKTSFSFFFHAIVENIFMKRHNAAWAWELHVGRLDSVHVRACTADMVRFWFFVFECRSGTWGGGALLEWWFKETFFLSHSFFMDACVRDVWWWICDWFITSMPMYVTGVVTPWSWHKTHWNHRGVICLKLLQKHICDPLTEIFGTCIGCKQSEEAPW